MTESHVVAQYYDAKTQALLAKYGPGPRVHYHIGAYNTSDWLLALRTNDLRVVGQILTSGQERVMEIAARTWNANEVFIGPCIDAGCGLGGGSIYWLSNHDVQMTAVTLVGEHVKIVEDFAALAGVDRRLTVEVGDVRTTPSSERGPFRGAVAMEAACYWNRARWFAHLATLLTPRGFVCIEDTFLCDRDVKLHFDEYWKTDIGTKDDYVADANASGFTLELDADITDLTTPFWYVSIAWNQLALAAAGTRQEQERLLRSSEQHRLFANMWERHAIEVRLLRFRFD